MSQKILLLIMAALVLAASLVGQQAQPAYPSPEDFRILTDRMTTLDQRVRVLEMRAGVKSPAPVPQRAAPPPATPPQRQGR